MKKISTALLAAILLLSGCSKHELPNEISNDSQSSSKISDPLDENSVPEAELLPSVTYGFHFGDEFISVSEDSVVFSPTIKCGKNPTKIGFLIFIDGVVQKYSVDDADSKIYTSFDVKGNSEEKNDLKIDGAFDADFEEHYITIVSMLAPDFKPSLDFPSFGHYHKILSGTMIAPERVENVLLTDKYNALKAENSVFTQKQIEKYKIVKMDETSIVEGVYLLQGDNRLEDHYELSEGENKLKLRFASFTTSPTIEAHRATFFVNHEPVKFNGGYDCLDFIQEGEKITELDIELENIKAGDIIYCVDIPLSTDSARVVYKSDSKMIIAESDSRDDDPGMTSDNQNSENSNDFQNSDTTDNSQTSDNIESSQSSDNSGDSQNSNSQVNSDKVKSINFEGRINPKFSIDGYIYATESKQDTALIKLDSNGNIVKKLADGLNFRVHDNKIATLTRGSSADGKSETVTLTLLDKDFNEIKKLSIHDDGTKYGYDFDENRIAYVYLNEDNSAEIRVCDWNFTSQKTLMSIPNGSNFGEIVLTDSCVAFKVTDKSGQYYGICDFSGKSEKYSKENMSSKVQTAENSVFWANKHGEPAGNGEVVQYINGKFIKIRTEFPTETQDIFPVAADEFFTTPSNLNVLRQYKNGVKCVDLSLENGESVISVVRAGQKIIAGIMTEDENKLKIWELS